MSAYRGDSGPRAELTGLAARADPFLCEADTDAHHGSEHSAHVHLTPEGAARVAAVSGLVRRAFPEPRPAEGQR
ncbi:hypothetical protein [Streptomyces olivaceoviridis]|uniref:hypothetical protein n=1 Tax=Streptomyces olivaceoviridis TaxID=1921 RepID=UPI0016732D2E